MKIKNCLLHLKTILKHKWYVFLACKNAGIVWRGIIHDLSKFNPLEFFESADNYVEGKTPLAVIKEKYGFAKGWLHHKGKNTHHWAYWIYLDTCDTPVTAIKMPYHDVVEMICDWVGASKSYSKEKWTTDLNWEWYQENKYKMILHLDTRKLVEEILSDIKIYGWKVTSRSMRYKYSKNPIFYMWY